MTLKLEVGKCYVDSMGEKCGPMFMVERGFYCYSGSRYHFYENGESATGLAPNLIYEWLEPKTKPTPFRDMSDAEKGALLLAYHEGKHIQCFLSSCKEWAAVDGAPLWTDYLAYRIAPPRITGTCEIGPDGKPDFSTWEGE